MSKPMFPVHFYEEGIDLPKEGIYYVVAGNGNWLHKDNGVIRSFVPVDKVSVLDDLEAKESIVYLLPKISHLDALRIRSFFIRVFQKHHAEANVILYFNKELQEYKIGVPMQKVTGASVQYRRTALSHMEGMEGYLRVGTIHSHCDFDAFHSGTDVGDERFFDGLHCTFGHNVHDHFSITASLVSNNTRRRIDPETVISGIANVHGEFYTMEPPSSPESAQEILDLANGWMEKCVAPEAEKPTKYHWTRDWIDGKGEPYDPQN